MTFTAFTYGDPAGSHASLSAVAVSLVGFTSSSNQYPVPVAADIAGGVVGIAYSETISAVGGAGGYTYGVHSGPLPSGLSLNSSTGVISGTPSAAVSATFTIRVTDSNGQTGDQSFTIEIVNAPSGSGNAGFMS